MAKQSGADLKRAGRSPAKPVARPEVWTKRMLEALANGVKGGKWYSLWDKICNPLTLETACKLVSAKKGGAGIDNQTVEAFSRNKDKNLARLREDLRTGRYRPRPVKRVWIPKPGSKELRPLGIPTVRDRIVQAAVWIVTGPIFEHTFAEQSYGFRPNRGCKDALRRVEQLLRSGHHHVVDADLQKYFDRIPHGQLLERVGERISDGKVLEIIEQFLKQGIMDGLEEWTPEMGTPQGAVLSPLLSNIYLNELDHEMARAGVEMIRYADDFVLLCRSQEEAETSLELAKAWIEKAGLTLHPEKTHIVQLSEGFDFLGYRFQGDRKYPRKKSLRKLKDNIRLVTKRNNGRCLPATIAKLNQILRGWFEYYKHCFKHTFKIIDGWVRMRLRSILRRRERRRGQGRGKDHIKWPNAFFAKRGLFFLTAAHAKTIRPYRKNHRLESRMRENRLSGSEGGGAGHQLSLPL